MRQLVSTFKQLTHYQKIILLVAVEVLVMVMSGVGFYGLHDAPYFNIGVDPIYWLFYFIGLPQFIINHAVVGFILNVFVFISLAILFFNSESRFFSFATFLLLMLFYVTLTGYLGHRNFQSGFVWVMLPFLWKRQKNRQFAFEGLRYWMLFFYVSAAYLKLSSAAIGDINHFSNVLQNQFLPYYVEHQLNWRTNLNLYLISHPVISYCMFLGAILFEGFALIGFFTKKYDVLIGIILISFHFFNWAVMDIAPIGQLSLLSLLFFRERFWNKN